MNKSNSMSSWRDISTDPNDRQLYQERTKILAAARAVHSITDREGYIAQQAAGLRVLDVGVVNHEIESALSPHSLHSQIRKSARECLGCDILPDEVEALRQAGWNVVCHDITSSVLDAEPFELIVCGEIIEHIDRPGDLFANCASMLRDGGKLMLSTPNPWFLNCVLKNVVEGKPFVENVDHVAWFEPCTLAALASRHGFRLVSYTGIRVTRTYSLKARVLFGLSSVLSRIGFRRELFDKTILYEFKKEKSV